MCLFANLMTIYMPKYNTGLLLGWQWAHIRRGCNRSTGSFLTILTRKPSTPAYIIDTSTNTRPRIPVFPLDEAATSMFAGNLAKLFIPSLLIQMNCSEQLTAVQSQNQFRDKLRFMSQVIHSSHPPKKFFFKRIVMIWK